MSRKLYEVQVLKARLQQLNLLQSQIKELTHILAGMSDNVDKLILEAADSNDKIRRSRLQRLRTELDLIAQDGFDAIEGQLRQGMVQGAKNAVEARVQAAVLLMQDINPQVVAVVPQGFAVLPVNAVKAVMAKEYRGAVFSDRIWDMQKYTQQTLANTVTKGIVEGKSAKNLAKELEAFLKMTDDEYRALQRSWREVHDEAWKVDWKTRGRLKYNTMRLARTELNHAFHEASIQAAYKAPWVRCVKWNLSASHPKYDICDEWATDNKYDLGKGCYPPMEAPIDHPNGFCFVTDETVSNEELANITVRQFLD